MSNRIICGLHLTHIATGIPTTITLNQKEMQLATAKTNINECWDLMCKSVFDREGVWIEGDYEVDAIVVNGKVKAFH